MIPRHPGELTPDRPWSDYMEEHGREEYSPPEDPGAFLIRPLRIGLLCIAVLAGGLLLFSVARVIDWRVLSGRSWYFVGVASGLCAGLLAAELAGRWRRR